MVPDAIGKPGEATYEKIGNPYGFHGGRRARACVSAASRLYEIPISLGLAPSRKHMPASAIACGGRSTPARLDAPGASCARRRWSISNDGPDPGRHWHWLLR